MFTNEIKNDLLIKNYFELCSYLLVFEDAVMEN